MPNYATIEDIPSENRDALTLALIEHASALITKTVKRATFRRAPDGLPVSQAIRDILTTATVQQVVFWNTNGINPALINAHAPTGRVIASKSLDGASFTYAGTSQEAARVQAARDTLCQLATLTLANAHLTIGHPRAIG